jgi:putative FmdB family regulatory protein
MPLYDFACPSCMHAFTVRQGFHDDHVANCPRCDAEARRRFSAPATVFKGSGFYVNDYGGKSASASSSSHDDGDGNSYSHEDGSEGASPADHGHSHPHTDLAGAHEH